MQKKWLSILLFAPLMQSNYALADQVTKKELDYKALGEVLFFDKSISFNKTQSCSTCHSPDTAFVDQRKNSANQMVSEGDNPHLHGNRNANTALYAMFSVEMGMPDKKAIVERLKADPTYYKPITDLYGESIWADTDKIYAIMEKAIGEFEKQELFAPFSSKYDRALKGEAELTALESEGKALFFDKTRTNCSNCHQSSEANSAKETFTNYRYFNIGVPSNQELIKHNKLAADFVDNGLLDNPMVKGDEKQKGKFKVPTLRNIGVTAPYMHNGVFRDLKTVLLFKDSFNNPNRKINPETGKAWEKAEYAQTINPDVLKAKPLTDEEINALEAFLKTLTDEAYEE